MWTIMNWWIVPYVKDVKMNVSSTFHHINLIQAAQSILETRISRRPQAVEQELSAFGLSVANPWNASEAVNGTIDTRTHTHTHAHTHTYSRWVLGIIRESRDSKESRFESWQHDLSWYNTNERGGCEFDHLNTECDQDADWYDLFESISTLVTHSRD